MNPENAQRRPPRRERSPYHPLSPEQAEALGIDWKKLEDERPINERVSFAGDVLGLVQKEPRRTFTEKLKRTLGRAWKGDYQQNLEEGLVKKQAMARLWFFITRFPDIVLLDATGATTKQAIPKIYQETKALIQDIHEKGIQTVGIQELTTVAKNIVQGAWMGCVPIQYTLSRILLYAGTELERNFLSPIVEAYKKKQLEAAQSGIVETPSPDTQVIDIGYDENEFEELQVANG